MAAPAALLAEPLAAAALERSGKIAAAVLDALRTPMLQNEVHTIRHTKRGVVERRSGFSVPAWAVVAGGIFAWFATHPPQLSQPPTLWGFLGLPRI